ELVQVRIHSRQDRSDFGIGFVHVAIEIESPPIPVLVFEYKVFEKVCRQPDRCWTACLGGPSEFTTARQCWPDLLPCARIPRGRIDAARGFDLRCCQARIRIRVRTFQYLRIEVTS